MKILVAVKRVIDPYVKIRVKPDNTGVEKDNIKMSMNPFDEIALEEALRLKEKKEAETIIIVSIGTEASVETLRHGLALGADRAILVKTNESFESLNIAKILQKIAQDEQIDLVLMGKQSIDGDNNQTPQMLAALSGWSQATFASEIVKKETTLEVTREIDGGLEKRAVSLPAVVSVDLRLNVPRYPRLPDIMKAKNKPLEVREANSLGLDLRQHSKVISVKAPISRQAGEMVESVDALLEKLKHEAKVI